MRTISALISCMMPGRPGRRRWEKFHFSATKRRCQRINVSGETTVSSFSSVLLPTALAFLASIARYVSENLIRFGPSFSLSSRFSACRISMTISWWRYTQPETVISTNDSRGDAERMPKVYQRLRRNCLTARDPRTGKSLVLRQAVERLRRENALRFLGLLSTRSLAPPPLRPSAFKTSTPRQHPPP